MNNDKKTKIARFGIASKGAVYSIAAILTLLAAFNAGGQISSSKDVFKFIEEQTFGQILLGIMILGLICYVFWRMYQTFANPEDKSGTSRIGYFFSGLGYGLLSYSAISILIGSNSSGSGSSKQNLVEKLLEQSWGAWVVGAIALVILGKAIYQLYRAYSGKFKEKLKEMGMKAKAREVMLKSGKIGYTARGIIIGIIAFFFMRAALTSDSSGVGGTEKVFEFVQTQSEWGTVMLILIAVGLLMYGIFMFVKARYREMGAV